jgi:Fasciclin domain
VILGVVFRNPANLLPRHWLGPRSALFDVSGSEHFRNSQRLLSAAHVGAEQARPADWERQGCRLCAPLSAEGVTCPAVLHSVALAIPVTLCAWTVQAADLIQTAEQVGRFNSFLRVLEATGMADMLKRDGPFTVFAPTDEAFAQLPQGTLDRLWRGTSCSRRLSSRTS